MFYGTNAEFGKSLSTSIVCDVCVVLEVLLHDTAYEGMQKPIPE